MVCFHNAWKKIANSRTRSGDDRSGTFRCFSVPKSIESKPPFIIMDDGFGFWVFCGSNDKRSVAGAGGNAKMVDVLLNELVDDPKGFSQDTNTSS